jgi:hypothetical protein
LRQLIKHVSSHMNALQASALDVPIQDLVLSYLILATLDADTLKDWESHAARPDIPLLTELITFLETRCKAFELLQNVQASKTLVATPVSPQSSGTKVSKPIHCNVVTLLQCTLCNGPQRLFKCENFLNLQPQQRFNRAKQLGCCFNC